MDSCDFVKDICTLENVKWRINVVLSSRDLSRVMEPVIYFDLSTTDGAKHSIEVPVSKFHSLRQNVALLLKEVESIKHKGTNIVRIMAPD